MSSHRDRGTFLPTPHRSGLVPIFIVVYSLEGETINGWLIAIGSALVVLVGAVGFVYGARRGPHFTRARAESERRLEEYDFYPFVINERDLVEFDADAFNRAAAHFLEHRNERAARELIVIGEQNLVRDTFSSQDLRRYKELYEAYDGDEVINENDSFLENYRRIVNHIGRSFPNTGIEILLHNLVNPARSLVTIENGAVTGRSIGSGATNLVLDLKTRRQRGEDKINYELNIGSRQFKCTTIPIFRPDYGLVGAICINIDARFLREAVVPNEAQLHAFMDNLLRTDFQLDENILSEDEYRNALNGKRHFLDEAIRGRGSATQERRLAAIFFSDIVDFTRLMGDDEASTMHILEANEEIHRKAFVTHRGRVLKRLGDGILASFDSASDAVAAAQDVQRAVNQEGRFRVRIGIHVGEVIQTAGDVHGDGVNIASRIEAEVPPGGIGVSEVVYDNIRNKAGLTATLLGQRALKNVTTPITLYSVET